MTEEQQKLLSDFETRVKMLIMVCDKLKLENSRLSHELKKEREKSALAENEIRELYSKYETLKMASAITGSNTDEVEKAKQRVTKLVREIDKCIALLNE